MAQTPKKRTELQQAAVDALHRYSDEGGVIDRSIHRLHEPGCQTRDDGGGIVSVYRVVFVLGTENEYKHRMFKIDRAGTVTGV